MQILSEAAARVAEQRYTSRCHLAPEEIPPARVGHSVMVKYFGHWFHLVITFSDIRDRVRWGIWTPLEAEFADGLASYVSEYGMEGVWFEREPITQEAARWEKLQVSAGQITPSTRGGVARKSAPDARTATRQNWMDAGLAGSTSELGSLDALLGSGIGAS